MEASLNKVDLADSQGNAWIPETLAAYMEKHNIQPEAIPGLSHLTPWNEGRPEAHPAHYRAWL